MENVRGPRCTGFDFLRQGTKAEEICFVKISQSYFEETKREKEKFLEKNIEIFPDWSVLVVAYQASSHSAS